MSGYSFDALSDMLVEELAAIQNNPAFAAMDRGTQDNITFFMHTHAAREHLHARIMRATKEELSEQAKSPQILCKFIGIGTPYYALKKELQHLNPPPEEAAPAPKPRTLWVTRIAALPALAGAAVTALAWFETAQHATPAAIAASIVLPLMTSALAYGAIKLHRHTVNRPAPINPQIAFKQEAISLNQKKMAYLKQKAHQTMLTTMATLQAQRATATPPVHTDQHLAIA